MLSGERKKAAPRLVLGLGLWTAPGDIPRKKVAGPQMTVFCCSTDCASNVKENVLTISIQAAGGGGKCRKLLVLHWKAACRGLSSFLFCWTLLETVRRRETRSASEAYARGFQNFLLWVVKEPSYEVVNGLFLIRWTGQPKKAETEDRSRSHLRWGFFPRQITGEIRFLPVIRRSKGVENKSAYNSEVHAGHGGYGHSVGCDLRIDYQKSFGDGGSALHQYAEGAIL